jgi:glycerol-3-phosphate dehydrogenase
LDSRRRRRTLEEAKDDLFDVVIIGGGITGAGALLDGSSRGLNCMLFEMQDFAQGTSSRSTKLIHGGLRYLKQLQFGVVAKTGKERAILNKNAPYLIKKVNMMLPIYKKGSLKKWSTYLALYVYELLAKVDKSERFQYLTKSEVLKLQPSLKGQGLRGAFIYTEYQTDDARLVIEILKTAANQKAKSFNYTKVEKIEKVDGGYQIDVKDTLNDQIYIFHAKAVINAAGPWIDDVLKKSTSKSVPAKIVHSKGVHLVVNDSWNLQQPIYFENTDGRMIFAIPRLDKVYIGTTDTLYVDDILNPECTEDDLQYLIQAVNAFFEKSIDKTQVISNWSGIRPLIKGGSNNTQELSRKDEIYISDNGIVTIAGGKLTGFRLMAKSVIDICIKLHFKDTLVPCRTAEIKLAGAELNSIKNPEIEENLSFKYGINAQLIYNHNKNTQLRDELTYCIHNEMCMNLADFFVRRSSMSYFEPEIIRESLESCTKILVQELGWDIERVESEKERLQDQLSFSL